LLEKLLEQGHEVMAFFHGAFYDDLLEVLRSERSFKAWKRKISRVPVLVLDDLFSNKQTERSESALFEIMDERVCNYKPTLVTTQVTGKDARSRFHSQKRGEAFFARVREFFKVIPFTKDTQGDLKV
jgi:DNA replication protein DnaC